MVATQLLVAKGKYMKKFIAILLCALGVFATISCKDKKGSATEYTVKFVQNGVQVGILKVVDGVYPEILPEIEPKTGYDLKWSKTDFSDIASDLTVTVIETPKTYTVTLNPDGGAFADGDTETKTVSVTYDADYTLPECVKDGFKFVAWKINENASCPLTGKWTYDENLILTAAYEQAEVENFKVRFVQTGYDDIVIEVKRGEKLTSIPLPREVKGYNVKWDADDLLDKVIDEYLTVNAVKTPKQYAVTLLYGGNKDETTATWDKKFVFPENDDVEYWYIDGVMASYSGEMTWNLDYDVVFIAKYVANIRIIISVAKNVDIPAIKTEFFVSKGTDIGKLLEFPDSGNTYDDAITGYKAIVDGKEVIIKKGDSFKVYGDTQLTVVTKKLWIGPY